MIANIGTSVNTAYTNGDSQVRAAPARKETRSMIDERFLTTGEVLKYLRVNLRTVYRLIKTGKIPAV